MLSSWGTKPEDLQPDLVGGLLQQRPVARHPVEDDAQLAAVDYLVFHYHLVNQCRRLQASGGGVADDDEGIDAADYLTVDLFDPGFAVDDDGVEALGQGLDGPAQEVVDRAEASQGLGAPHGQQGIAVCLDQGLQDHVVQPVGYLGLLALVSAPGGLDDVLADLPHGPLDLHAEGVGQAQSRVGIDQEQLAGLAALQEGSGHHGGEGGLAGAALAAYGDQPLGHLELSVIRAILLP